MATLTSNSKTRTARPEKFVPNETYVLTYNWTDPIEGPITAPTPAIFTGRIFLLANVEYGEFIHVENKKVRRLSMAMLDRLFPVPDRVIADDDSWAETGAPDSGD